MKYKGVFKSITALVIGISLAFAGTSAFAASVGGSCVKLGTTSKSGTKTLICKAVGKKKLWTIKTVSPAKPAVDPRLTKVWTSACELDPFVPAEWKPVQSYLKSFNYCDAPYTFAPVTTVTGQPVSQVTANSSLADISKCRLVNQRSRFGNIGFPTTEIKTHPGPTTRFQVIPVRTLDSAQTGSTPQAEYGHYFKYIESVLEYISDGAADVSFSVPSTYYSLNVNISDAGIGKHGPPNSAGKAFFDAAIKAVDKDVDFSNVDYSLVIIPAQSKANLLGVQPWVSGVSAEGPVENALSLSPISAVNELKNMDYLGVQPLGVLHELYHGGFELDDHYGNQKWSMGADLGMANWGLMSTIKSDLTAWEKWIVGFHLNSQVRCADTSSTSTHWLVPGGIKTTKSKLLVVPLSSTKVIVVESVRPAGLNYKVPKQSQGALVYLVDVAEARHGYGMSLLMPAGRVLEVEGPNEKFIGASAPLKLNETLTIEGITLKVIEAGTFGDVIQVSKAG